MIIVVFISIIMSIFVGIQDPIIQKFAIRIAGGYISSKTGTEVRIGRLYIAPDFTIQIDQFSVKDLKKTNLLNVEELKVRPVMEDIIHGTIHVGRVELNEAQANLITYEGEDHLNFQFLIDAFSSGNEKESGGNTEVYVDQIMLRNLDFQFWNQNKDNLEKTEQHLMDYAHLAVDSIYLDLKNLVIINDSITARINNLSANEISGFRVRDFRSEVNVSPSGILLDSLRFKTNNSNLHLDLHMLFDSYRAISSFVDSVRFDTRIYPTKLMISDLGPFTDLLYEMPDLVLFEGWMRGPVRNFNIKELRLNLGEHTRFLGDITLQPLNMKDRVQVLNIKRFDYNIEDLAQFYLPIPSKTIPLPTALTSLDHGTINGHFSGSFRKFRTSLNVTSEVGNVNVALEKHLNENRENVFEGEVNAERLNAGQLAKASNIIGLLDLSAYVTGRQTKKGDFELDIDGAAHNVQLLGTLIDEIKMDGNLLEQRFNGKINIDDNDLGLNFSGRFDFSDPKALGGNFEADITHADLHHLHMVKNDEVAQLKASITANMTNLNKFNEAEGTLNIDNVSFTNSSGDYVMKEFKASITNDNLFQKRINANCDFFDFEMAGQMDFTTITTAFKQYIYSYVEVPQWTDELEAFATKEMSADQDFIINLNIKNPKPLTKLLMPSLTIAKNTTLNGTFTSKAKSLNLTLRSSNIKLNNIKFNNLECKSFSSPRRSITQLNLAEIVLRDSTATDSTRICLEHFQTSITLNNDSVKGMIVWDDLGAVDHNKAKITGSYVPTYTGGRFNISSANILLNDSLWTISPDNFVIFDDGRIQISNLALQSQRQYLGADGYVPTHTGDTLAVTLNRFNLATINFLLESAGLELGGLVSGEASVSDLQEDPTVFANLGIDHLGINGQDYGDAVIFSQWNNDESAVEIDMKLTDRKKDVFKLLGAYHTSKEDENLDFKLSTDELDISILSPFLNGIVHRLQGSCTGDVDISGSLNKPALQGSLRIADGGCIVDYLNTFYTFEPTINLSEKMISFDHFTLTDTTGNYALVSGNIMHNYLKNFVLDIKLYPNNFLAMATNADISPSFYGTAIANGVVKVQGPTDNLNLDIKAMTMKGTTMTIPLGGKSAVKKHEFITFVNHKADLPEEEEGPVVETPQKKRKSGFNINLELNVNDNAQVKIALPNNLGQMEARGDGTIKIGLPANSKMTLIGDYVIKNGSLALVIQDMLKKNFSLESGSSISWTGDPVNGTINVTGVYQTKAALSSLGLIDSTNMTSSNVKVDCMVHLKNKLLNPDITFGLRLPKATEEMQQVVFNVIDTTNQSEVLVQAVYLMLFNTFNYGSALAGSYGGFLSNQVNDIISQFTNDIDINFNYKPGGEQNNEEMTVALKKQLFDDRLTIETNFGVIIPTTNYSSNSTNIVGDFNIDYKFTKDGRFSGQVFNRSNFNTIYYQYTYYKVAPYTQGIGLTYSKSFDTFSDLFKKRTNTLDMPNRPMLGRPTGRGGSNNQQTKNDEPSE